MGLSPGFETVTSEALAGAVPLMGATELLVPEGGHGVLDNAGGVGEHLLVAHAALRRVYLVEATCVVIPTACGGLLWVGRESSVRRYDAVTQGAPKALGVKAHRAIAQGHVLHPALHLTTTT